jgi:anti-sigma-K factor RskA
MSEQLLSGGDRDLLAAELALGLLEGEELSRAFVILNRDVELAEAVGRWSGLLASMLASISPQEPPEFVWKSIAIRIGMPADNNNFAVIHRTMVAWRRAALAAGALAAALSMFLIVRPDAVPPPVPRAEASQTLVAALTTPENDVRLVATWEPISGRLRVASSALQEGDPQASHELWIIAAGDSVPRSLGVLSGAARGPIDVPSSLLSDLKAGATLAISVEPRGGSPTGVPTGPVIATGRLEPV